MIKQWTPAPTRRRSAGGLTGYGAEAGVQQFGDLLDDVSARWPDDTAFLSTCAWNLGEALLLVDNAPAALPVLEAAVHNARQVYGDVHFKTLKRRLTHLDAVAATSGPPAAVALARQLVDDSGRALGESHLTTLEVRCRVATWTAEAGQVDAAVRMFQELEGDAVAALGENHWLVENVRAKRTQLPET